MTHIYATQLQCVQTNFNTFSIKIQQYQQHKRTIWKCHLQSDRYFLQFSNVKKKNNQMPITYKTTHVMDVSTYSIRLLHRVFVTTLLTHWGPVTHICVVKLTIIASDNGLSPGRRQAIIWTNAGILLIGHLGTNFIEILIGIQTFSFKKMHLKMSSAKWRPFCLGLNVLKLYFSHFLNLSRLYDRTSRTCHARNQLIDYLCQSGCGFSEVHNFSLHNVYPMQRIYQRLINSCWCW